MTREEAAKILEEHGFLVESRDFEEAMESGAAALRRLNQLERWATAWADNYDSRDTWAEMACFGMMLNAIHGEIEWPSNSWTWNHPGDDI